MRFFNLLREEVYRIFHTPSFLFVLLFLLALVLADGCLAYAAYQQNLSSVLGTVPVGPDGLFEQLPFLETNTLYNSWIGGRPNSVLGTVFIYMIPACTAVSYSWTYRSEERSGYVRIIIARAGKNAYFFSKHLAVFFAGALVILIPMLVNLLFMACLIPAYSPNVDMAFYYQINTSALLRDFYYAHPMKALLCNVGEITLFAGLWSTVPLAISYFERNLFIALFAPYLVLLFAIACAERASVYRSFLDMSIFHYIQLTAAGMTQSLWVLLGELGLLLVVPLIITWGKGAFSDVF